MRFLHTSDWQLGMTRHFFSEGAQERFTQARFDAVAALASEATRRDCAFVVVAGDVFETNQVDRRTVSRAIAALEEFSVPVYLLPGNHDCFDPGSVYRSTGFLDRCPPHVHVLTDSEPRTPVAGIEIVGAPWTSKRPLSDLASAACAMQLADGHLRVVVAHGAVDAVIGEVTANPSIIRIDDIEAAVAAGTVHYLALGDRHSCTEVGSTGRVWYSGSQEPTSYREDDAGTALLVDLQPGAIEVERVHVGTWQFLVIEQEVDGDDDIENLREQLGSVTDRARAIVKVKLTGSLTLRQLAVLETLLDEQSDVFGALEQPERHRDLVIRPDDNDFRDLELRGYAAVARDRLQERADRDGPDAEVAADALSLLLRLAGETA